MRPGEIFEKLGESLSDSETLPDISRASFQMAPVLALVAVGNVTNDIREGRSLSTGAKLSVAGFITSVAISAAAAVRS